MGNMTTTQETQSMLTDAPADPTDDRNSLIRIRSIVVGHGDHPAELDLLDRMIEDVS